MAKTGRVAFLGGVGEDFQIAEHPVPKAAPGTCVIKTELTGVCATDVHYWMGMKPTYHQTFPMVYGHEFCGIIEDLGEGLKTDYLGREIKVGDRIALKPMQMCGKCYWCAGVKVPMKCESAVSYGDAGYFDPWFIGGFADYVYIMYPKSEFFKTTVKPEVAVMLEPLSIAVNAITSGKQKIGDTVVVQGSGPIGLLTTMCAKFYGADKVIVVGGPKNRLELAKEIGADVVIDIDDIKDPAERIKMVTDLCNDGKGADVVYECAGFPPAVKEGLEYLRFGGCYVEAGHFANAGEISLNPALTMCSKVVTIVGAWASSTDHFVQAIKLMECGRLPIDKLVTHKIPLDRITETFKACSTDYMMDGREIVKAAVDPHGSPWEK
jgi:threonine dehydrogenase-like Zn-dependent dehydrogenase